MDNRTLNGLIWNVRGMSDKEKIDFIKECVSKYMLDFIGIQETIKQEFSPNFLSGIGGDMEFNWTWNPARGKSGGILVGINKNSFDILEKEQGEYFIRTLLSNKKDGFCCYLVIVYGDAQPAGKPKFLVELVHTINK